MVGLYPTELIVIREELDVFCTSQCIISDPLLGPIIFHFLLKFLGPKLSVTIPCVPINTYRHNYFLFINLFHLQFYAVLTDIQVQCDSDALVLCWCLFLRINP